MQKKTGIAVVIKNDQDQVLLTQRGPKARSEAGFWENPGGGVEPGEDSREAARREIKEELGVDLTSVKLLNQEEFPADEKGIVWSIEVFEGKIAGEPKIMEPEKCSQIAWFSGDELKKLPLTSYTKSDFKRFGWI